MINWKKACEKHHFTYKMQDNAKCKTERNGDYSDGYHNRGNPRNNKAVTGLENKMLLMYENEVFQCFHRFLWIIMAISRPGMMSMLIPLEFMTCCSLDPTINILAIICLVSVLYYTNLQWQLAIGMEC